MTLIHLLVLLILPLLAILTTFITMFYQKIVNSFLFSGATTSPLPPMAALDTRSDHMLEIAETKLNTQLLRTAARLHVYAVAPWQQLADLSTPHAADAPGVPLLTLLLHGNGGTIENSWARTTRELQREAGGVCATFDYRGYGRSTGGPPSLHASAQDAGSVLDYLVATFQPLRVVLYGRSLGAAVAVELLEARRGALVLEALVLETPFLGLGTVALPFVRFLPEVCRAREKLADLMAQDKRLECTVLLAENDEVLDNLAIRKGLSERVDVVVAEGAEHNGVHGTKQWEHVVATKVKNCRA